MPKFVRNAKIALINRALEVKKTEVNEEIRIRDPAKLQMFLDEEEKSLRTMVEKVMDSGRNVVLCQKGIDDVAQHYHAKEGIFAVRRVKESDMKKLAKATGAQIVTNLDDLAQKQLGNADLVEERKIGTDDMTFVTGNKKARAVSVLVRGGTEHVVDEVERILHDALRVVSAAIEDGKAIAGGGSAEIELSLALENYAATVGGREQLAIEAFAKALEVIPRTLGQNAGLDPIDVLIKLRAEHGKKNSKSMGVNVVTGEPMDMLKANIVEPLRVKTQEIDSAAEVASMILRIDDVIASKKSPPRPPGGGGDVAPRLLDRFPVAFLRIVDGAPGVDAEAQAPPSGQSGKEDEDGEHEEERRDGQERHAGVDRVCAERNHDSEPDSEEEDREAQELCRDPAVVRVGPFRTARLHAYAPSTTSAPNFPRDTSSPKFVRFT